MGCNFLVVSKTFLFMDKVVEYVNLFLALGSAVKWCLSQLLINFGSQTFYLFARAEKAPEAKKKLTVVSGLDTIIVD